MRRVQRCLLVLRPTETWVERVLAANPVFDEHDREGVRGDGEAYLLPAMPDRAAAEAWVERRWRFFTEQQLMDWIPDRRRWPRPLTRAHFHAWFEPEIREWLWDLAQHDA